MAAHERVADAGRAEVESGQFAHGARQPQNSTGAPVQPGGGKLKGILRKPRSGEVGAMSAAGPGAGYGAEAGGHGLAGGGKPMGWDDPTVAKQDGTPSGGAGSGAGSRPFGRLRVVNH